MGDRRSRSKASEGANQFVRTEAFRAALDTLLEACDAMLRANNTGYAYSLLHLVEDFRIAEDELVNPGVMEVVGEMHRARVRLHAYRDCFMEWVRLLRLLRPSKLEIGEERFKGITEGVRFFAHSFSDVANVLVQCARKRRNMPGHWVDKYANFRTEWNDNLTRMERAVRGITVVNWPPHLGELGVLAAP